MYSSNSQEGNDAQILEAIQQAGINPSELWLYYFLLGGSKSELQIHTYYYDRQSLLEHDRRLIAHAFVEILCDPDRPRTTPPDELE